MQKFQSRVANVITGATYDIRSANVLETLDVGIRRGTILKKSIYIFFRVRLGLGFTLGLLLFFTIGPAAGEIVTAYKILNNYTAPNLKESFQKTNEYQNTYNLRNNDNYMNLALPKAKTEFLRKRFKYSGAGRIVELF